MLVAASIRVISLSGHLLLVESRFFIGLTDAVWDVGLHDAVCLDMLSWVSITVSYFDVKI